jgi:FAD/FMN-containing dehydrogenase
VTVDFAELAERVGERLLHVRAPLRACRPGAHGPGCEAELGRLANPYAIEDNPGAFHTTGWLAAYDARHSPVAVAAESAADIAAAVDFARDRGLGLVVKGTGHDYLGRSSAPGSLLVWTHRMREVTVHDAFIPAGAQCSGQGAPAVTVGAGTRWLEAYQAVAARGRYVQGGGCTSVGAAGGFPQGGGFGPLSRRYGTAAGNMLEAEVMTASGEIVVANAHQHPDLFWALRGGGGGTFGVVSRLTMRTHPMPSTLAIVTGTIRAGGGDGFRRLIGALVRFLPGLCDDHWGEQVQLNGDNTATFLMIAVDLTEAEARETWRPFLGWVAADPSAFSSDVSVSAIPFGSIWNAAAWDEVLPGMVCHDDRQGQPPGRFWWAGDQAQVSQYLHAYKSRWLPGRLFEESPDDLADALFAASRHWVISLHLNKGLLGAASEAVARDRATAINGAVFDAAALIITASMQQFAFPGVPGHEPDLALAADRARRVGRAMDVIRALTPDSGSYLNEADYFEPGWQRGFWGGNYPRLLEIKRAYDPTNLFQVHHGVSSEDAGL